MGIIDRLLEHIPVPLRYTVMLQSFGFFKIPLIFFIRPKIVCLDDEQCVIRVPLKRKVKNHLNTMYFGALAIAAECTGGVAAMKEIRESGERISLVFKDFQAEFLKRVEGDAVFSCVDVPKIKIFVKDVIGSGERKQLPFSVVATCPEKLGDEPVAIFTVTISLKKLS
jgi:acyl-coenzyme A thioesterase PaaI-like protein